MAIFLSHASADVEVARAIAMWLKAETGADVFVSDIDPGAEWQREILLTVQACSLGIVLLTENSIGSTWVNFEIGAMLALGKKVIPLCAGEFRKAALPTTLSHLQGCDIDNPVDLANMMRRIDASLERPPRQGVRPVPPTVTVTPAKERLFKQRSEAAPAFTRIIQDALRHQQELCVAGIANTDFFGGSNPRINDTLKRALADGLRARFIFLDPSSPATLRRGLAERDRLRTHETIVGGIGTAAHVQRGHRDRLRIRLAQEVSCFLCFNNRELLFQPYLVSVTGTGTPTQLLYDDQLLRWMRLHFEALWGERWVLFDVGNVLVSFDHRRAAENLEKFLPHDKRGPEAVEAIHRFLHDDPHEHSRNMRMDIGELAVSQLTNEFRREFGARCDVGEFTQAWCSIFDVNQHAVDCLNRVQALGVRVGIASNTNAPHWDFLCRNFPVFQDPGIRTFLSFEIKHQKHAGEFFHRVLEETTRPPEEHLLLDDLEVNLRSAATVGMKTQKVAHLADFDPIDRFLRDHFWL